MQTVVGLFDDFQQAKNAAFDLESAGISHEAISLVANNDKGQYATTTTETTTEDTTYSAGSETATGAVAGGVVGLLVGLAPFLIPGLGAIAAAGWLTMTLAGVGVGAVVGLAGSLIHAGVPHEEAHYYSEGVKRGGTLLVVKSENEMADRVAQILQDDGAVDIHERAAQWRQEGYLPPPQDPRIAAAATTSPSVAAGTTAGTGSWGMQHASRANDYSTYERDWQNDFQANYANQGLTYDQYASAYEYGADMAYDPRYRGQNWNTIEPQLRSDWETRQPGTWNTFRNAVRYSWDKVTGAQRGGVQTGGYDADGTPDTRGIMEKTADAITGDRIDDKTGKTVS
ncbi:MAG TPA: hypothetical protein VKT32_13720 [Chthonomonadaceae bacterium]|nr:hypothetical protein [Chthonomonadaceae bacterium]